MAEGGDAKWRWDQTKVLQHEGVVVVARGVDADKGDARRMGHGGEEEDR